MNTEVLVRKIEADFCEKYPRFKEFQSDEQFRPLWDMCIETAKDYENMICIKFCNDIYQIPPVRVFTDINREKLKVLSVSHSNSFFTDDGQLKSFVKQCLGAFWGMVFRYGLEPNYDDRRTVSVVKNNYFGISTASRFVHDSKN